MIRLACLVIIFCLLSNSLLFANESAADILFEKGMSDMQEKKYKDAEKAFSSAVEVFPEHFRSYFKLGELCEITDRQLDAIKNYDIALTILLQKESLNAEEAICKREIELSLQRTDKLRAKYKSSKDECVEALLKLVEEARKDKRTDLLAKIYADVLYLDPQNPAALKGAKELTEQNKPAEIVKTPPSLKEFRDIFNGKDLQSWKNEQDDKSDMKNNEIFIATEPRYCSYLTCKDKTLDDKYSIAIKFRGEYAPVDNRVVCGTGIYFGFVNLDKNFYVVRANDSAVVINYCVMAEGAAGLYRNYKLIDQLSIENYKSNDWNVLIVRVNKQDVTVFFNDMLVFENVKLEEKTSGKIGVTAGEGSIRIKEVKLSGK